MKKLFKKRICAISFCAAFVVALAVSVLPILAGDPVNKPNMVRVKDEVEKVMIYSLPNDNKQETGLYVYSGEVYELFGVYETGFCGIYYFDGTGNKKVGYCYSSNFIRCATKLGIDVSHYQGNIDWEDVASDKVDNKHSVDYAMIKVGQTSSVASRVAFMDSKFVEYIEGATNNGIAAGVYFYSKATTAEQAKSEAQWVIDKIKDYNITMPVAFDYEDKCTLSLSDSSRTEICKAFVDTVEASGYECVLYSYQSYLENNLQLSEIQPNYDFWAARYSKTLPTFTNTKMWQFTDCGTVDGIKGNVDLNWSFY